MNDHAPQNPEHVIEDGIIKEGIWRIRCSCKFITPPCDSIPLANEAIREHIAQFSTQPRIVRGPGPGCAGSEIRIRFLEMIANPERFETIAYVQARILVEIAAQLAEANDLARFEMGLDD